ncbi:hypothetical protein CCACVL1_07382 [Corchorus capsularis]|uniref:Uncharacterized protein n=1 Tax=Corchorus capsularis TaxID=210143 RepID=A0A1R3J6J2_COCAP|nr:hypothetical protein CCACVL1_07382 [Corchorus capsularis]
MEYHAYSFLRKTKSLSTLSLHSTKEDTQSRPRLH